MKYQVFGNDHYLCTINQTLRVTDAAFDCERCKHAMQYLIDQHPVGLLIIPEGEHKKSKAVTLADIAPKLVAKKAKKRPTNTYLQGANFLKKGSPKNNKLQAGKSVFSENLKSADIAVK